MSGSPADTGTGLDELRPVLLVTRACSEAGARVIGVLRRHGGFALRGMVCADACGGESVEHGGIRRVTSDAQPLVEIVRGDFDDLESLRRAMAGCCGVVGIVPASAGAAHAMQSLIDAAADVGAGRVAIVLANGDAETGHNITGFDHAGTTARADPDITDYARSAGIDIVVSRASDDSADIESLAAVLSGVGFGTAGARR